MNAQHIRLIWISLLLAVVAICLPSLALAAAENGDIVMIDANGRAALPEGTDPSMGLSMFLYAMGGSGTCFSCTFLSYFMYGLAEFSYIVYLYFYKLFILIAPVSLLIWLGYRVAKLMITGGEDGKSFIMQVISRLALFTFIWLIAIGADATKNEKYLWSMSGPLFLEYSFKMANGIKTASLGQMGMGAGTGSNSIVLCVGDGSVTPQNGSSDSWSPKAMSEPFVNQAIEIGCFTERTHIVGIATGLVLITDGMPASPSGKGFLAWMVAAVELMIGWAIKLLIGGAVVSIYLMSAVYLVFLVLDVVVRGLVTAAFSPIILLMYLYQPLRGFATGAVKALAGALVTAVALSIVSVLGFVLITNVADVYNDSYGQVQQNFQNLDAGIWQELTDNGAGKVGLMGNFLNRISLSSDDRGFIPFEFSTPWLWYLIFCGLSLSALGKKMVKMLQGLIGDNGESTFAESAEKTAGAAKKAGMGVAIGGVMASGMLANKLKGPAAGVLGAGAGMALGGLGSAAKMAGGAMMNGINQTGYTKGNALANSGLMGSGAQGQGASKPGALGSVVQGAVNAAGDLTNDGENSGQ